MKYFLPLLFCLFLQPVFAQDENRHAAAQTPEDVSMTAARRFEGRLTRLHEALDKNDVASMTACYANLLGDMRSAIDYMEKNAPGSRKLTDMQSVLGKFENFTFDPMKPAELKPYLPNFDDFLALLREK